MSYKRGFNALNFFLAMLGIIISVALVFFAPEAHLVALIFSVILIFGFLLPVISGVRRAYSGLEQVPEPPDEVRDFLVVSYASSSDEDMSEMYQFALKRFGETFPDDVDTAAVRKGGALGLRLADPEGKNIGFLDVYHFRPDVLDQWRYGNLKELTMTIDQFVPISSIADTHHKTIDLVIGALFVDTAHPVADYHLAHALVEAGEEYLNFVCRDFQSVRLYASIFSPAGLRWATNQGFQLDIRGDKRGAEGDGHDVYVLQFTPRASAIREVIRVYSKSHEYRLRLRI